MRPKFWEVVAGVVGAIFAGVFIFGNVWGIGVGLLCADALWLLTRIEIVEKTGAPGRYAGFRGRLGLVKLVLVFGVYGAVIWGTTVVRSDGSGTRLGLVASFALAGLAFMLLGEATRSADATLKWLVGARAERHVGGKLDRLVESGWLVLHGYKRDWGGDLDHVVSGPGGIFAIETKSSAFRRADLRQAAWNAAWLKGKLDVPWVTGVLCVNEDRPPQLERTIWVMGHAQLVPWLKEQRNTPVDHQRVRQALARPASSRNGFSQLMRRRA